MHDLKDKVIKKNYQFITSTFTGCFFYPVKITCNDKLSWYSNDPKFIIAAENLSQFSELHAKNWKGIVDDKQFSNYQNNLKEKEKNHKEEIDYGNG